MNLTPATLREMTDAYLLVALATTAAEDGLDTLDRLPSLPPWSLEALEAAEADCRRFLAELARFDLVAPYPNDPGRLGNDFWLTRNNHGAGFWDRDDLTAIPATVPVRTGEPPDNLGDAMTVIATRYPFGESDAYVGDDGTLYLT